MENGTINVLYIDDEPNNLTSFKAAFRREFNILTALSAEEGREVLEQNEIHVIFTDQRMPGTTGVEFLESIVDEYPKPIRILITGYADIGAVIDAINRGRVFRYITKPWDDGQVREAIESAFKVYMSREEKNFFVYKASHDLKGPLVSVKGLINIIKIELGEKNEVKEYIDLVDGSINHLDDTLTELIEYKRIGETKPVGAPIAVESMIRDILDSLKHVENFAANIFEINVELEREFYCDKSLFKSILQNLIQNSIKYGRYSRNQARVEISITESDAKTLDVTIKDNGLGMSEEIRKNIFKMFYRGNTDMQGSGLGLYIVKTALEKLNGSISVNSVSGEGSVFLVQVPQIQPELMIGK